MTTQIIELLVFLAVFGTQFARLYSAESLGFKDFSSPYWPHGREKPPAFNFKHYDPTKPVTPRIGVPDFAAPFYNSLAMMLVTPLVGLLLWVLLPHQLDGWWALWAAKLPIWMILMAMYKGLNDWILLIAIQILKVARPANHGFWAFPSYTLGVIVLGTYFHNLDISTVLAALGVAGISLAYLFFGTGRQEMGAKGWLAMGICTLGSMVNMINSSLTLHTLGWFTYLSLAYATMFGICVAMALLKPAIGWLRNDQDIFRREGFRLFWPAPKAKVAQVSGIFVLSDYMVIAAMGNVLSILTVFGAMRLASLAMMYFGDRWQFGREERYFADAKNWPQGYALKPFRYKVAGYYGIALFVLVLFIAYMRQNGVAG